METYDTYALEWFKLNQEGSSLREIARHYGVSHNSVSRILRKHQFLIKEWHTGKFQDITNQEFGLITAIEPTSKSSKGEYYWKCYCACNPRKSLKILGPDLRRGRKMHCGCNFPRKFNISGRKFGLLTANKDSGIRNNGHVMWECTCTCSTKTLVTYGDLSSGHTKSCGCQRPKGENHHKWTGGSEIKLYLRGHLKYWKRASLAKYNYKCVISGMKTQIEIHHVNKSFIEILHEALDKCDLQLLSTIGEYSTEGLETLIKKVISLHYEYGLGVAITRDLHNEFHSMYGYNCTNEDFKNFINIKNDE